MTWASMTLRPLALIALNSAMKASATGTSMPTATPMPNRQNQKSSTVGAVADKMVTQNSRIRSNRNILRRPSRSVK